jgi:hypothetical protein
MCEQYGLNAFVPKESVFWGARARPALCLARTRPGVGGVAKRGGPKTIFDQKGSHGVVWVVWGRTGRSQDLFRRRMRFFRGVCSEWRGRYSLPPLIRGWGGV